MPIHVGLLVYFYSIMIILYISGSFKVNGFMRCWTDCGCFEIHLAFSKRRNRIFVFKKSFIYIKLLVLQSWVWLIYRTPQIFKGVQVRQYGMVHVVLRQENMKGCYLIRALSVASRILFKKGIKPANKREKSSPFW